MFEIDLTQSVIDKFTQLSQSGNKNTMKNVSVIEDKEDIKDIISEFIDPSTVVVGSLFNHANPFAVHSDMKTGKKTILLIPIESHNPDQTFVIFDQRLDSDVGMSWIHDIFSDKTDEELKDMYYDKSLRCRPCDSPEVKGCTDHPISDELFKYLPYSKDLYHGLTGYAWKYTVGKGLLFDADMLHATGRMNGPKIGCTIHFTESIENIEINIQKHKISY
jgi:hypothetical protein